MTSWRRTALVLVALVAAVGPAAVGVASAQGAKPCVETKGPAAAAGTKGLVELQPNGTRPTFDIDLGKSSGADDQLPLAPKVRTDLASVEDISADVVERPRAGTKPLRAKIDVAATLDGPRRHVLLDVCVADVPRFTAGKFEGMLSVYGPKVEDLSYALVVTTKYPGWVAALVLAVTVGVFIGVAVVSKSLVFQTQNTRTVIGPFLGVAFAIAFTAPVYWSSYAQNSTWGDNLGGNVAALVVAGFTAATAGLAVAHRLVGGEQSGGGAGGGR